MDTYNKGNFQGKASSNVLLGAALGDGMMAGLVGGILGLIVPIIGILSQNASLSALAVIANLLIYVITGILAGYFFYSRKMGRGWVVSVAGTLGGLLAGAISGIAVGLSLGRLPQLASQIDTNILWATWGIMSGLGAAIIGALTAWIPGLFIRFDSSAYNLSYQTPAMSPKEISQYEQVGQRFKRRMKIRSMVGIASVALVFAWYFCQGLIR